MYKQINYLLIISFIIILFIIADIFIKKYFVKNNNIIEHYYTYFFPYLDLEKSNILQFYENKEYNTKNFNNQFIFIPLNIIFSFNDINNNQNYNISFINLFSKLLISKTNFVKINVVENNDTIKNLHLLNNNKVNIGYFSASIISNAYIGEVDYFDKPLTNLKFIAKTDKQVLLIFTKKSKNINSINSLPLGTKIGMMNDKSSSYIIAKDILNHLEYKENTDYKFIYKNISQYDFVNLLIKDEIDLYFYLKTGTDNKISEFITNNVSSQLLILPFNINKEKVFFKKNFYYQKYNLDLYKLSISYLPKKIMNDSWTIFRPNLDTISVDNYIITNSQIDNHISYGIIKLIYDHKDIFNNYEFKNNEIFLDDIRVLTEISLPISEGCRVFYTERGLISYNDNPNCKYLVGKKECNQQNLEDNNLILNTFIENT